MGSGLVSLFYVFIFLFATEDGSLHWLARVDFVSSTTVSGILSVACPFHLHDIRRCRHGFGIIRTGVLGMVTSSRRFNGGIHFWCGCHEAYPIGFHLRFGMIYYATDPWVFWMRRPGNEIVDAHRVLFHRSSNRTWHFPVRGPIGSFVFRYCTRKRRLVADGDFPMDSDDWTWLT